MPTAPAYEKGKLYQIPITDLAPDHPGRMPGRPDHYPPDPHRHRPQKAGTRDDHGL